MRRRRPNREQRTSPPHTAVRRTASPSRNHWLPILLFVAAVAAPAARAWQPGFDEWDDSESQFARLTPEHDRDAAAWLKRAAVAAERGDWKLAADTLERVITQHGDSTIAVGEGRYRSAIHLAQEQIAGWPPEGLAAYRVLYDSEAKLLLDRGRDESDLNALRVVARRYSNTTHGPEAIDLLAGRLVDRYQASEAIDLLERLEALADQRVPRWRVLQKLAIAYALANQRQRAVETLEEMRALEGARLDALPADWEERIVALQRFFEDLKFKPRRSQPSSGFAVWPHRMGPSDAQGRFGAIEPILDEEFVASAPLPGAERLDRRLALNVMRSTARPPVWQAVTDGERVFVTCPSGLVARDLATLELLWQAFPKFKRQASQRPPIMFRIVGPGFEDPPPDDVRLDEDTVRALFREHRGEISTAFGLVFLIEQDGTPGEQLPTREGILPANDHISDEDLAASNTLRAYEAETGRLVWRKGRSGPADDPLRFARFYAAPIAVNDSLVAPYLQGDDFHLAVLHPDGTLANKVLIGSGQPGLFPMNGTLQPTVSDGTLYVPTGAGCLAALNQYDYAMRWLAPYNRSRATRPHSQLRRRAFHQPNVIAQADEWLSSPPVVAGGAVMIGPHDGDELLAFETTDGARRWSFPRNYENLDLRYVIGADESLVLAAGRGIVAVDIERGEAVWKTASLGLAGRSALCGDVVLAPTHTGLLRLDLATGKVLAEAESSGAPWGNLFAFEGSLLSIGLNDILKFTDPDQSRRLAFDRLERNPGDVEASVRLAWLSTLSEDWPTALRHLESATQALRGYSDLGMGPGEAASSTAHAKLQDQVSHLRVETLLALSSGTSVAEERRRLLVDALGAARRPEDRVRAGLAFADQLADSKKHSDALRQALRLLSEDTSSTMKFEADLRGHADVAIRQHAYRYWQDVPEADRPATLRSIETTAQAALADGNLETLGRLAACFRFLEIGPRLDLAIARALGVEHQETAVFHLTRAAKLGAGSDVELEALLELAMTLRAPGGELPAAPTESLRSLERLESDFPNTKLPADLCRRTGLGPDARVGQFVDALRSTLPKGLIQTEWTLPTILRDSIELSLISDDVFDGDPVGQARSFQLAPSTTDTHAEVLPIYISGGIRGLAANENAPYPVHWECRLQRDMLGDTPEQTIRDSIAFPAAIVGRVAALTIPSGVCGVGLTSGREMWPPLTVDASSGALPSPAVLGIGEVIVAAADPQTLVAIEARGGASPIWRRKWSQPPLGRLWRVNDHLVVADKNGAKGYLVDPLSGRIRRAYDLLPGSDEDLVADEAAPADPDAHLAVVGSTICRSGHHQVFGRDVTSGRPLWTAENLGLIKGLYELSGRYLGVAHDKDRFSVIDGETGARVRDIETLGLVLPPIDVVLDELCRPNFPAAKQLLFFARTDELPPEYVLQPYLLEGDREPWQGNGRYELGPAATISPQMLRASPDYVAVVKNVVKEDDASDAPFPEIDREKEPELLILDKVTGMKVRSQLRTYLFNEGRLRDHHDSRRITDVIIMDQRIVAIAPEGYFVLGGKRVEESTDVRGLR